MKDNFPKALTPHFITNHPNEKIILYEGSINISDDNISDENNRTNQEGKISFDWFPTPMIQFESSRNLRIINSFDQTSKRISIGSKQGSILVSLTENKTTVIDNEITETCTGIVKNPIIIIPEPTNLNLDHVLFHLVNFCKFNGLWLRAENTQKSWDGRQILEANNWRVIIERIHDFKELDEELFSLGGYAITAIGKLEKIDKSSFPPEEAEELLDALHYFFSFVKGAWSSPILPIGLDAEDNKVWEKWEAPNIDYWRSTRSWFNGDGESLSNLFPGFWDLWQDSDLQQPIKLAIHWYVESSKKVASIEGSIALQQIALEMLSWVVLVECESRFTEADFNNTRNFNAQKKIEELLKFYGIPICIPSHLSHLVGLSTSYTLSSGPHVITWVRNKVIHGNFKNRYKLLALSTEETRETWELGKLYLELVLLGMFKYQGYHFDWTQKNYTIGLQTGELVPWITLTP
ncbi:hypothetical protein [Anabaena lutea]|uniref:YopA central domain-containing protein n=1 Tax=Anabaena lutea FACHB-196 TaxID=2692881 RepID=A0ABR8FN87_9NOST|nr:hypothetical protein [Anabaena lutea]MBD2571259.1 hypothetical protein [Anabaena lutea FACHB-196]